MELMKESQLEQDMKADRASVLSSAEKRGHGEPHETKNSGTLGTRGEDPAPVQEALDSQVDAPPDGGSQAWTQVAMAHLVVFNTWGAVTSFGFFQTYYATTLGRPLADISWVGSVQLFFLLFIGTVSGRALDAGYFRHVFIAGKILLVLGIFLTSVCTKYWQLFLAQGVCIGVANGLVFCPTAALVATYFSKRRAFAMSITSTGTATGGLICPAVAQRLLPDIGFPWTVRVMGLITFVTSVITIICLRPRPQSKTPGPLVDWMAFTEVPYVLYCIGSFFVFMALLFANYYIGVYGREIIGIRFEDSVSLLMVMNGVGIPGRLIPGLLADYFLGSLNLLCPFAALSGIAMLVWTGVRSVSGLWAFSAFYGFFAAGTQALFASALHALTADPRKAGVRMGMCLSFISFACLTGPPLAGVLIQQKDGEFLYAQVWAGGMLVCGSLTLVAARVAKVGFRLREKI